MSRLSRSLKLTVSFLLAALIVFGIAMPANLTAEAATVGVTTEPPATYRYPLSPGTRDWSQVYVYHFYLAYYSWQNTSNGLSSQPFSDVPYGMGQYPNDPNDKYWCVPNVETALEIMKRIDSVTRGIPKVAIIHGWNEYTDTPTGVAPWDCGWPSLVTASHLLCTNSKNVFDPLHKSDPATDPCAAIRWLMTEAREQGNTYCTMHVNFVGAQMNSPLWQYYADNELLSSDAPQGSSHQQYLNQLVGNGWINGYVNLQKSLDIGEFQKRIDELMQTYPEILTTGLLHDDHNVDTASPYHGLTQDGANAAFKKCMEYIKDKYNVDVSAEAGHVQGSNVETAYGMQARAGEEANFTGLGAPIGLDYMQSPNYLFLIGNGGLNDRRDMGTTDGGLIPGKESLLFGATQLISLNTLNWVGTSDPGDNLYVPNGITPNALFSMFSSTALPWHYQNSLLRLSATKTSSAADPTIPSGQERYTSVQFSEGVRSYINGSYGAGNVVLEKAGGGVNGQLLTMRNGNDTFVPELWKVSREIMAFSFDGYQGKEWVLPSDWAGVASVDLYNNTLLGVSLRGSIPVNNGKITLTLGQNDGVIIVPHGDDPNNQQFRYDIASSTATAPTGGASLVGVDRATSGKWIGTYGTDGYAIPGYDMTGKLPGYASVSYEGGATAPFSGSPSGMLQDPAGSGAKVGTNWQAQLNQIIDVDVGNATKYVSIYLLDGNKQNCQVMIEPIDGNTNQRLGDHASALVNSYQDGKYVTYQVTGHVRFRITRFHFDHYGSGATGYEAGPPSFAGVFFDSVAPNPAPYAGPSSVYVSDMNWISANHESRGYPGSVQRNNPIVPDGNPIDISGSKYAKGIGTHTDTNGSIPADVNVDIEDMGYTVFSADVGVDGRVAAGSSTDSKTLIFQIIVDGAVKAQSPVLGGDSQPYHLTADIPADGKTLTLRVVNGSGAGTWADWGDARLSTASDTSGDPSGGGTPANSSSYVSDMTWISANHGSQGYSGEVQRDNPIVPDGNPIKIQTVEYAKGIGTHTDTNGNAPADVQVNIEGMGFSSFEAYVGIDARVASGSSTAGKTLIFQVIVDGNIKAESPQLDGNSPPFQLTANIPSDGKVLTLRVINGSGTAGGTWADWGNARLSKVGETPTVNSTGTIGVNCGSNIAQDGLSPDQAYKPGEWGYTGNTIATASNNSISNYSNFGFSNDTPLRTVRYADSSAFDYIFDVSNGNYTVSLYFAECWDPAPGGYRPMDISINASKVLSGFDPATVAGGLNIGIEKSFNITVTGGSIDIHFAASYGASDANPMISAIVVTRVMP